MALTAQDIVRQSDAIMANLGMPNGQSNGTASPVGNDLDLDIFSNESMNMSGINWENMEIDNADWLDSLFTQEQSSTIDPSNGNESGERSTAGGDADQEATVVETHAANFFEAQGFGNLLQTSAADIGKRGRQGEQTEAQNGKKSKVDDTKQNGKPEEQTRDTEDTIRVAQPEDAASEVTNEQNASTKAVAGSPADVREAAPVVEERNIAPQLLTLTKQPRQTQGPSPHQQAEATPEALQRYKAYQRGLLEQQYRQQIIQEQQQQRSRELERQRQLQQQQLLQHQQQQMLQHQQQQPLLQRRMHARHPDPLMQQVSAELIQETEQLQQNTNSIMSSFRKSIALSNASEAPEQNGSPTEDGQKSPVEAKQPESAESPRRRASMEAKRSHQVLKSQMENQQKMQLQQLEMRRRAETHKAASASGAVAPASISPLRGLTSQQTDRICLELAAHTLRRVENSRAQGLSTEVPEVQRNFDFNRSLVKNDQQREALLREFHATYSRISQMRVLAQRQMLGPFPNMQALQAEWGRLNARKGDFWNVIKPRPHPLVSTPAGPRYAPSGQGNQYHGGVVVDPALQAQTISNGHTIVMHRPSMTAFPLPHLERRRSAEAEQQLAIQQHRIHSQVLNREAAAAAAGQVYPQHARGGFMLPPDLQQTRRSSTPEQNSVDHEFNGKKRDVSSERSPPAAKKARRQSDVSTKEQANGNPKQTSATPSPSVQRPQQTRLPAQKIEVPMNQIPENIPQVLDLPIESISKPGTIEIIHIYAKLSSCVNQLVEAEEQLRQIKAQQQLELCVRCHERFTQSNINGCQTRHRWSHLEDEQLWYAECCGLSVSGGDAIPQDLTSEVCFRGQHESDPNKLALYGGNGGQFSFPCDTAGRDGVGSSSGARNHESVSALVSPFQKDQQLTLRNQFFSSEKYPGHPRASNLQSTPSHPNKSSNVTSFASATRCANNALQPGVVPRSSRWHSPPDNLLELPSGASHSFAGVLSTALSVTGC